MLKRAEFAKELEMPIIMHDYLTGGFTANTTLAKWAATMVAAAAHPPRYARCNRPSEEPRNALPTLASVCGCPVVTTSTPVQ